MALLSLTVFDGATGVYTIFLDPAAVTAIDVSPDVATWCRVYLRGRETPYVSPQPAANVAAYLATELAPMMLPVLPLAVRANGTALYFSASAVTEVRDVPGDATLTAISLLGIETPFRIVGLPAAVSAAINVALGFAGTQFANWPTYGTVRSLFQGPSCFDGFAVTPWFTGVAGANAAAQVLSAAAGDRQGVWQLTTGTTATGRCATCWGANSAANAGTTRWRADVNLPLASDGVETFLVYAGLADAFTSEPNNGAYFRYDFATNGGRWQFLIRAGGVTTHAVDTGVAGWEATGLAYRALELELTTSGARWAIDGAVGASLSGSVPTGTGQTFGPQVNARKTLGANSRVVNIDLMGIAEIGLTAR